ncbi:MAG TPA: biotin/lipoate A/B protein ligase family protein [Xanthobacteraceae bacterium]|nr:biotin/lipoate A/B protein ligase family protein [Xanthobacteraceae bacterium]
MTVLRVIDSGVAPARWNIAVTAALAELHRAGSVPDTLRFHRYPRSVLLGRHQVLDREIDTEQCRRRNLEIARRVTGGGAVYMCPGILAWDLVMDRAQLGARLGAAAEHVCATVADGLRRLGVAARVDPPNDIVIDGRKVSGSSGAFDGPALVHQGTVVLEFDRAEMAGVLKARPGRLAPAARVTSLAESLGRAPTADEVRDALTAAMSHAWGASVREAELSADERALAQVLLEREIGTDAFVFGTDAPDAEPAVGRRAVRGAPR